MQIANRVELPRDRNPKKEGQAAKTNRKPIEKGGVIARKEVMAFAEHILAMHDW